jgi:hypothetical protein
VGDDRTPRQREALAHYAQDMLREELSRPVDRRADDGLPIRNGRCQSTAGSSIATIVASAHTCVT